jgi:hypothetical protein
MSLCLALVWGVFKKSAHRVERHFERSEKSAFEHDSAFRFRAEAHFGFIIQCQRMRNNLPQPSRLYRMSIVSFAKG